MMIVKATYTITKKDGSTRTFNFESDKLPNDARNFFLKNLILEFTIQGIKKTQCYEKASVMWKEEYGQTLSFDSIRDIATDNYSPAERKIKRDRAIQRKKKELNKVREENR